MASRFLVQIIDGDTKKPAVSFRPGSAVEAELEDAVIARLRTKGIGYFRSAATVEIAVREAWAEALMDLKKQVRP